MGRKGKKKRAVPAYLLTTDADIEVSMRTSSHLVNDQKYSEVLKDDRMISAVVVGCLGSNYVMAGWQVP